MKIKLSNFSRMNPEVPEYSTTNQHFSISGVDPIYYLTQSTVQEQKAAPLAAARTFASIATLPSGNYVACAIPCYFNGSAQYDIVVGTDTGSFYGIAANGTITTFPTLSQSTDQTGNLSVYNGKLWYNYEGTVSMFSHPINDGTGTWTTSSFSLNNSSSFSRPMNTYQGLLLVADSTGGVGTAKHVVKTINTGNTFGISQDIGAWNDIVAIASSTTKYTYIAAGYTGIDTTAVGNFAASYYLNIWDGNVRGLIPYVIPMPGIPIDMQYLLGDLYVILLERTGQMALYVLAGTRLKRLFSIAIDTVKQGANGLTGKAGLALFEYAGMIGINLFTKGQYLYSPQLGRFILTPQDMDFVILSGTAGRLYGIKGTSVYLYGTGYSPISYRSQWIPFKDLTSVVVKYATPPQGVGDSIQITLDGFDEDGTASSSLALNTITSTTFYNGYKTPLDVMGFQGNLVRITVTTASAGTWQPIIRELELISN